MSVQVKGSGTIGGLDEGLVVSGIVTSSTQVNVGSNIKLGNAGVVTATSFVGSGANLTSLPAQATIANNADNRVITGGSGVNLNGEANLTYNGSILHNQISAGARNDYSTSADGLIIEKGGSTGLSIDPGSSGTASIYFPNESNHSIAAITHNNSTGELRVRGEDHVLISTNNNTERLRITANGHLLLGTSTDYADNNSDDVQIYGTGHTGMSITSGSSNYGSIYFGDGTSGDARNEGIVRYNHSNNSMELWTNRSLKLTLDSGGRLLVGDASNNAATGAAIVQVQKTSGDMLLVRNHATNYESLILSVASGTADIYASSGGSTSRPALRFITNDAERLRITSAGIIQCGTSGVLKAEINNAVSGHQFISQCSDNNNGFEVYQKHGSSTTRNTFAAYANTGGGASKELHFAVRGDGIVTKPKTPAFRAHDSNHAQNGFLTFDQIATNVGSHYNGSNGRFTVPVAGTYFFTFYGMLSTSSGNARVEYYINGSVHSSGEHYGGVAYTNGATYNMISCSTVLTLAVNDYVNLNWNTSYNSMHSYHNGFMGYLIG